MPCESIELDIIQFLFSTSRALDAVEEEILGAAQNHSRRVAYLAVCLGKRLGFSEDELTDLAAFALLHDNALTEYVCLERLHGEEVPMGSVKDDFAFHCVAGEENSRVFPFLNREENVIRYHHENMDGTGLFGVRGEHIPLKARILRVADHVDVLYRLSDWTSAKKRLVFAHLRENAGSLYDAALSGELEQILDGLEPVDLTDGRVERSLFRILAPRKISLPYRDLIRISAFFAHIIDYKSPFTMSHSRGIAEKTRVMAGFYGFDSKTANEVYVAAYLHDIGKLATPNTLLEKPGRLTPEEYEVVKLHVWRTHEILRVVERFGDIERWESGHHERLDGSGYFRGSTGREQDFCTRLLACIDVYQALVEDRPYRRGMEPDQALSILREQVDNGKLDGRIVSDIGRVLVPGLG